MLLGLTAGQKFVLAGTAAIFMAFSLVSALVIPRYRPDFPGRDGLRAFVGVTLVLFVLMLAAVEFFAVEDEEPGHGGEPAETQPQSG